MSVIKFENVSKFYKLYNSPKDRLKEALHPFGKKRHREFYALKNISLEFKKREIVGIIGRNGSGKSTLLKIISGVIPINAGKVTITGKISALLDLGAGMNPEYDGIQNIYFGGIMLGFSREEMKTKMNDIISFADIGDFIHQPLKTYSTGMKARLGFSLAVSVQPEILVVDEVLAVGDDLFRRKCFAKMEALISSGCTVFFVSHQLPHIIELCTQAILLDKGEIILSGPPIMVTRYYHKFLYASPRIQNEIREEIIKLNMMRDKKENYIHRPDRNGKLEKSKSSQNDPAQDKKEDESKPIAYSIPNFIPKTTVKNGLAEVKIFDIQILTLTGEKVNALVMNEYYTITYKVSFNLEVENVRFTTAINNEKGLTISGFNIYLDESQKIYPGEVYLIKNRFDCMLLTGTYFISISVAKTGENYETIRLSGLHDAAVFKVQSEKKEKDIHWGMINLGQMGQIEKITSPGQEK